MRVITASADEHLAPLRTIQETLDLGLCPHQRAILAKNMEGFEARMETINHNGRRVAEALRESPAVDEVMYPGFGSEAEASLAGALLSPGRGGLLSFSLKEKGLEPLRRFYDAIRKPVLKGPGLGGETSLICPYVMLAHYRDDPAFLESQGLDMHSLRLSVGVEPVEEILAALGVASS